MRQECDLTIEVSIVNNVSEYLTGFSGGNTFHIRLWRTLYNMHILYIIFFLQMLYNIYNNVEGDRILLT